MTIDEIFNKDGLLGKKFDRYEERPAQTAMAKLVEQTIVEKGIATIEGETGVGKSFGYLIPILLSGKQAIVSTSNKALQDQLNLKDLPTLRDILPMEVEWVVLKGRSNYFCSEHFEGAKEDLLRNGMSEYDIQEMAKWAHNNDHCGDMDFYPYEIAPKVRDLVTCDRDTSHDKDSKLICYANEARRLAKTANVVLTNHSLLAIDLSIRLKSEGKAGILPAHPIVVLDEAHAFEQYAMLAFSVDVSVKSLYHLLDWYEVKKITKQPERAGLLSSFLQAISKYLPTKGDKGYYQATSYPKFEGFEYTTEFLSQLRGRLGAIDSDKLDERSHTRLMRIKKECDNLREKLLALGLENVDELKWAEAYDYGGKPQISMKSVPLDISDLLSEVLYPNRTVIATSATMTTGGKFEFFREQMGMPSNTKELVAQSPFDFAHNAVAYFTDGTRDKVEELQELLGYSQGRAFVLFTSYKEMKYMYEYTNVPYPKLIQQGGVNRQQLLEDFKATPNAVLFATKSFWEGVDVQGQELSMVVIDKLPFPNPYEPINKAKMDRVDRKQGKGKSFYRLSVPEACIAFKQGIGRLIRSTTDKGVIAILDPRLNHANYAKAFVDSLPRDIGRTRKMENVQRFFENMSS